MSDRHAGYVVTLDRSLRDDDSDRIIDAIGLIQGVVAVEPVVDNYSIQIAQTRSRTDLRNRLFKALEE